MKLLTHLLNNTFSISRLSRVSDGQGGHKEAWVDMGAVAGRLRPLSASERVVADQAQARITHVLYLDGGSDIARGDQVEGAGLVVTVVAVREPSRAEHHLEVDCLEVQREVQEGGS